ncbi:MAG: signal peptidase II [Defluviitaleaceae bacterium]|nr:signal peptidase II [Defluviitaleaceae bacterium]
MTKKLVWLIFAVSVVVLLALDLWLKHWAAANLQGQPDRVLIEGLLGLRYLRNHGGFFGFLANFGGAQILLSVLKIVILGGLGWYYHRLPTERKFWYMRVPIILIFAGGVGNLVDRVALGYVRDMLRFLFWENFAIFNLADVYVTVGVFALMIVGLFIVKDFPFP